MLASNDPVLVPSASVYTCSHPTTVMCVLPAHVRAIDSRKMSFG